jgi:hypothetical protein
LTTPFAVNAGLGAAVATTLSVTGMVMEGRPVCTGVTNTLAWYVPAGGRLITVLAQSERLPYKVKIVRGGSS